MGNKLRVVLAGYGNIGHAFESILKQSGDDVELTVCEIRNGCDCRDYIADHAESIDAVVNLCTSPTSSVLDVCLDKKVDYLDAGVESFPADTTLYDYFNRLLAIRSDSRIMYGFGINPGILEYVYFRYKPNGRHLAFEFEYDDGVSDKAPVFNTWSPSSYFDEAVLAPKYIVTAENPYVDLTEELNTRGPLKLFTGGKEREFLMIPHEELFSFPRLEKNCVGTGYLYQAPVSMQNFCVNVGKKASEADVEKIPTLYDISGEDHVGMLFYDFADPSNPYFVKNTASHQEVYRKHGVNATCWQTASGVYTGLRLLPLVEKGKPVTMSDLALKFSREIGDVLDGLGFRLERVDHAVDQAEFQKEILPLFSRYCL